MRAQIFALIIALLPAGVSAERLLCLGQNAPFMFDGTGDAARFDYLGDGTFEIDPPLPARRDDFSRHELVTLAKRLPLYLDTTPCRMFGRDMGQRIEIVVRSAAGPKPLAGCCIWKER